MKKNLLLVASILVLTNSIKAQDAEKNFRFGLKITPEPTWMRSNDLKNVQRDRTRFGFGFGLQTEFRINSTASFVTGVGGDFLGGKQIYKNGQGYILTKDETYTESRKTDFTTINGATGLAAGNRLYILKSRSIKATYVTIPVMLKLMTKDIGGFKYFGMFGGNIAVQTKFRCADDITALNFNTGANMYEEGETITITDMKPDGDLLPVNVGLNAGLGLEYNLSGNTSVFLSVNYLRGFINQYQANSEIIVDKVKENANNHTKPANSKQSAYSDGIQLNIGILF